MKFKLDPALKKAIILRLVDYLAIIGAIAGAVILGYLLLTGVLPQWFKDLTGGFQKALSAQGEGTPYR